jgi:hypothetical protein
MRQAEFSALAPVIEGLNHLQSTYDWNLHKKDGKSLVLDCFSRKIKVNTEYLPLAFSQNEGIVALLDGLAQFHAKPYINKRDHVISKHGIEAADRFDEELIVTTTNYVNKWSRLLYHFHMYRQELNNTVLISRELLMALGDTEFPTTTEYLKSPFRSFYLMFEPGSILTNGLNTGDPRGEINGDYDYEGAFVNLDTGDNEDTVLRINMIVRQTKKNKDILHNLDPVNTYWELWIPKGNDMMVGISNAVENLEQEAKMMHSYTHYGDPVPKGIMNHFSNTVVQVLLYMTSVNRDSVLIEREYKQINKNRTKKFIEREKTQISYAVLGTRTNYIGNSVNKNGNTSNKNGTGKKLQFKTIVRGHWHSFWYKNEEKIAKIPPFMHREEKYDDMGKKMIKCIKWVAPYHKGEGEMVNKEYKLTTGGRKLKKGA